MSILPMYFEITCHFLRLLFAEGGNDIAMDFAILQVITCCYTRTQDQRLVSRVIEPCSFPLRHDRVDTNAMDLTILGILCSYYVCLIIPCFTRTYVKLLNLMHNGFLCTCEC